MKKQFSKLGFGTVPVAIISYCQEKTCTTFDPMHDSVDSDIDMFSSEWHLKIAPAEQRKQGKYTSTWIFWLSPDQHTQKPKAFSGTSTLDKTIFWNREFSP